MEWQPIETAPKDGKPVLGWAKSFTYPCVFQWQTEDDNADCVEGWYVYGVEHATAEPTRWMPLPKPPTD